MLLKEKLQTLKKTELLELAKSLELRKYSSLNKADLIDLIVEYLGAGEDLQSKLFGLTAEQKQLLGEVCEETQSEAVCEKTEQAADKETDTVAETKEAAETKTETVKTTAQTTAAPSQAKTMGIPYNINRGQNVMPRMMYGNRNPRQRVRAEKKIYPNDLCPCGSGMKYKKCCGKNK